MRALGWSAPISPNAVALAALPVIFAYARAHLEAFSSKSYEPSEPAGHGRRLYLRKLRMGVDRRTQSVLDEYLVLASQAGDQRALEELARRWTPKLLRYAARMVGSVDLARDIVQDTWAGVIRGLHALDDPGRFAAWIYGIAHRRCIDSIRKLSRQRRLTEALDAQPIDPAHRVHEEESIDMQRAIRTLSSDHREVISLFYGEDLDVDEIATVVGIPQGTVKSRLFNARRQLRELFTDRPEEGE